MGSRLAPSGNAPERRAPHVAAGRDGRDCVCVGRRYSRLEVSPLMNNEVHNGRSLVAILSEMKSELQEFAQTRIELFKREMQEKAAAIKAAVPSALIGATFLITAFLLLTLALVALVATGFGDSPYKWFFEAGGDQSNQRQREQQKSRDRKSTRL